MPKEKSSHTTLVSSWLRKIPLPKHYKADGAKIFCEPCCKSYHCGQYCDFVKHSVTQAHVKNAERFDNRPERQQLLTQEQPRRNQFYADLTEACVSAGISWNKLSNSKLRDFLEKYTEKSIPDESTLRKNYLKGLYAQSIESIRKEIGNSAFWVAIDETTDSAGRMIANLMIGALRKDMPSLSHLLMCRELSQTNNSTITQVMDSFALLFIQNHSQADIEKRFLLFLTDGVNYMRKAGKNLKALYPKILHVTCLARGINRVAGEVRSFYPNVDKRVGSIKAVFRKSPSRITKVKKMFPELELPPRPVVTRCGTWLDATEYYDQNFNSVKAVIDTFDAQEAKCIEVAQHLMDHCETLRDLAYISSNFTFLSGVIVQLQERNRPVSDVIAIVQNAKKQLEGGKGAVTQAVFAKMDAILTKNQDLLEIEPISEILDGEKDEVTGILEEFEPARTMSFKFAPLTTVDVERSFSIHKWLLSDRRRALTVENLEMEIVSHFSLMY